MAASVPTNVPTTVLVRLAGSDVMGNKLARRLASGYLSLIGDTGIAASTNAGDNTLEVAGMQTGQREAIKIGSTSSSAGFVALLRGTADIAMSTRKITPAEAERLSSVGDLTNPANEHVIAVQGIAAIVSPGNRIPALTVGQIRDVLSGKMKDWSDLGGTPGAIKVYAVDSREGGIDAPHDFLMAVGSMTGQAVIVANEAALAAAVAADRNGVGLVTVGNTGSARTVPVAESGAIPVAPTDLSIATEDYPLTRRLYFYTGNGAASGVVRRFSEYVASPAGQAAVEASGLVALNVRAEATAVPDTASDRFRQLVAGSTRVSVDFRFQAGSTELDSRGIRDLDRLVNYMKTQRITPNRLVLAAFADNNGPNALNQSVSQKRAEAVAAALTRSGIAPGKVTAFGSDLPVADNATADGRERNRRVEVYLAP